MYKIGELEDKIIAALNDGIDVTWRVKIDTLGKAPAVEDIETLAINFPAVYLVYGSSISKKEGPMGAASAEHEFILYVCAGNLRGEADARRGDVGAYEMIDTIRICLQNNDLDLNIEPLMESVCDAQLVTKTAAIYSISFVFQEIMN